MIGFRVFPGIVIAVAVAGCDDGGAGSSTSTSTATASSSTASSSTISSSLASPRSASVPPIEATLRDAAWKLTVRLDPLGPSASMEVRGARRTLSAISLDLLGEDAAGSIPRDGGALPAHATLRYRLRFTMDECEGAPAAPEGAWPGTCGHREGEPPPEHPAIFEVLIDRESSYWPTGEVHKLIAACVPRSGAGPTCKLEGSVSTLAP